MSSSFLFAVVACSSGSSTTSKVLQPPEGWTPAAPSTPSATNQHALAYFDGTVDAVRGVMNLVVRDATGAIKSQATLPYGDNAGQVYMHTCNATYNSGTHQLSGNVQAVNLMSGTVTGMNAVVDSVSVTGVTLASGSGAGGSSGIIASYGSVAVNTPNCASTQPWAFQNLSGDPSFTFKGHADGVAPSGGPGTFTESYVLGEAPTEAQISHWTSFKASLTGTYSSITLSGSEDPTGRTCTGAAANTLCQAIHNATDSSATVTATCGGFEWLVGTAAECNCGVGFIEISATSVAQECSCGAEYALRPDGLDCNPAAWGSINGATSCGAPSQSITLNCH